MATLRLSVRPATSGQRALEREGGWGRVEGVGVGGWGGGGGGGFGFGFENARDDHGRDQIQFTAGMFVDEAVEL